MIVDSRDFDEVLVQLTRQRRWIAHYFGGKDAPSLIAFTFEWQGCSCADVLLLRGDYDATAYRTPIDGRTDVLRPELVCWSYHASAEATAIWAMRAVLSLYPPTHPHAPFRLYSAPASCRVPEERPLVIRPTRISA